MPPVRSIKNQYHGVNAHLHSYWQQEGGWDAFHHNHITYLTSALKAKLLPMGYTAEAQQSLQIRRFGEPAGRPESDVTVYDNNPARPFRPQPSSTGGVVALPIAEIMNIREELSQYTAIAIYEFDPGQSDRGEPVAWLELLSPSNKPGGRDADYYRDKRFKIVRSGIVFVELDYLHQSPPTFDLPRYNPVESELGANPYRIVMIEPRPVFIEGKAYPAQFAVDEPIPTLDIPLNAGDLLRFDFDAPYQRTFEELFYGLEFVDYSQLPINFDRYSRDDQTRILARMQAVLKASKNSVDLEANAPLPTESISYTDALTQVQALQS